MKFLQCLICQNELEIIGEEGYRKLIKCKECGFQSTSKQKKPEVLIIRKIKRS